MLENQTPELFQDVNKPKYNGTLNLDRWALSPSIEFCTCLQCVLVLLGSMVWGGEAVPPVAFGLPWGGYGLMDMRAVQAVRLTHAPTGQPGKPALSWTTLWPSPL